MTKRYLLSLAVLLLSLTGCEKDSAPESEGITVAATIGMIADIVRVVAGDEANVVGIIGEGVDPHLYQPTTNDIKELQSADLIFYNGLHLEGKMGDVLERLAAAGKPVTVVTETILEDSDYIISEDAEQDPHVWMDVQGWIKAVEVVTAALSDFMPENAEAFAANSTAYLAELEKLDAYAKQAIGSIPEGQRTLVTAHDAFSYMARAYGLDVKGIQGLSTESEAGVRDIEDLVELLVTSKIPAVFVETSVSDKNIRALIEGAKARGHEVVIGGSLFSDAMGPAGTYEGTYIGMIDHNVTTIANALGGEAAGFGK